MDVVPLGTMGVDKQLTKATTPDSVDHQLQGGGDQVGVGVGAMWSHERCAEFVAMAIAVTALPSAARDSTVTITSSSPRRSVLKP